MLLSSSQVITRSQTQEESSLRHKIEEESSMLRRKIEELSKNTVFLIAEAGKLIQESKLLSDRLKSFEDRSTKRKVLIPKPNPVIQVSEAKPRPAPKRDDAVSIFIRANKQVS